MTAIGTRWGAILERTIAAPGTGDPEHMVDDLGGGRGRLPTPNHLQRMIELVESLPSG